MLKQANIHITEDGRIIPIESTETMIDEAEDEVCTFFYLFAWFTNILHFKVQTHD